MILNKKKKTHQRILGEALSSARKERGLSHEALAKVVCLSKWHIKELEEADTFLTFYSMAIKIQAAKRIGHYLGLSEDQYLKCTE
jgi:transcriptional regulator with XRE-family HTH domain